MKRQIVYLAYFCTLLLSFNLHAGTKGKITGTVLDAQTKAPLIGANLMLEGTMLGAATDQNGYFIILNIPPGRYTLRASMMGYKMVRTEQVMVSSDITTKVDVKMEITFIEGETVVVQAKRPVIQKDLTGKESIIDATMIQDAPVDEVSELLTLESNVIEVEGSAVGIPYYADLGIPQVHVRGGRVSEVQYLVDGLPVSNPIFGELAVKMNKKSISEMQILAGSFNAEYGNAMSGLVNIVTKEGSQNWTASIDYKTTALTGLMGVKSDELWELHDVSGALSGPLSSITGIKNTSFFASFRDKKGAYAVYEFDDIVYDPQNPDKMYSGYGKPRYVNPLDTIPGWRDFGFDDQRDGTLKLTLPFSSNLKLNLSGSASYWRYKAYNFWWIYNMDSRNVNEHKTLQFSATLNHMISEKTFYNFGISRFYKSRQQRVYRTVDGETVELEPAPLDPTIEVDTTVVYHSSEPHDPYYNEFNIGDDEFWTDEFQTTYNVKFDITSQVAKHHLLKSGIDFRYYSLDVNEQEEVHAGGGHYLTIYKKTPVQAALYFQDKMEYDYLIINAGLRLDYEKSEGNMWDDPTQWKSEQVETKPYWLLSPRLGVALPVTDRTVFHYNYGIFYQHAQYRNRYIYPDKEYALTAIWPLLGNPNLEPEKTTAYELGLKQQISEEK